MSTGRRSWIAACLLIAAGGCAQSGSLLAKRTSVGSLKTSLSHLEYENRQLRSEVATLKSDNRQMENRLVQEESLNGELSARLDDARTLLGRRSPGSADEADATAVDPGPVEPRRTLPAGRSNKKRRKAPFVQIPGPIDTLPPADDRDGWEKPSARPGDLQGRLEGGELWLPIARGTTEPTSPRR